VWWSGTGEDRDIFVHLGAFGDLNDGGSRFSHGTPASNLDTDTDRHAVPDRDSASQSNADSHTHGNSDFRSSFDAHADFHSSRSSVEPNHR
jgi:hypothetical protein